MPACYSDWLGDAIVESLLPQSHYLHIANDVLPALVQRGVTQDQIDQMLIRNPRMFLEQR